MRFKNLQQHNTGSNVSEEKTTIRLRIAGLHYAGNHAALKIRAMTHFQAAGAGEI
jgi:hypothetical protein